MHWICKIRHFVFISSATFSYSLYAIDAGEQTYARCISEERDKKIATLKANCANGKTDAVIEACNERANDAKVDTASIEYCKLLAGWTKCGSTCDESGEAPYTGNLDKKSDFKVATPTPTAGVARPRAKPATQVQRDPQPSTKSPVSKSQNTPADKTASTPKAKSTPTDDSKSSQNDGDNSLSSADEERDPADQPLASDDEDPAAARAQADQDVASCQRAQTNAQTCCRNPLACMSASDQRQYNQLRSIAQQGDSEGLKAACQQMQQTGDTGSQINTRVGATCTSNQVSCSRSCAALEQRYRQAMSSCGNCASADVYSSAYSALVAARQECDGLQAEADALSRQGLQANSSAYAQYCQPTSSATGQSASGGGAPDSQNTGFSNRRGQASDACAFDPRAPECQAANGTRPGESGEAGFRDASTASRDGKSGFILSNSEAGNGFGGYGRSGEGAKPSDPPQVRPVPQQGSSGGIGVFGGGGDGARLPPRGGPSPGSPGFSTDIDQGFLSGGAAQGAGGSAAAQAQGGWRGLAGRFKSRLWGSSSKDQSGYIGLDLKAYLPGGSRDPGRAGGLGRSREILPKEENIWARISNKMQEKCKLGLLWQCR